MHKFISSFIVIHRCCNALNRSEGTSRNSVQKLLVQNLTMGRTITRTCRPFVSSVAISFLLSTLLTMVLFLLQLDLLQINSIAPRCKNTWMNVSPSRIRFILKRRGQKSSDGESKRSQCLHGTPGAGTCCEPARETSSRYFLASVGTQIFDRNYFINRSHEQKTHSKFKSVHSDLTGLPCFNEVIITINHLSYKHLYNMIFTKIVYKMSVL